MEFKLEDKIEIPAISRAVGGGTKYPFADMKADQSFLLPVAVPNNVKDPEERAQVFKEQARVVSNRMAGATRRFRKSHPNARFAVRTVAEGVRVWRLGDAKPEEPKAAPAKPAADKKKQ
jgi:hypothetical protein